MSADSFTFEGRDIPIRPGHTLAAALIGSGHVELRRTQKNDARGVFCGMGICQDCLVTVDGVPNQRACMTAARTGQVVTRQVALPELGTSRGPEPAEEARRIEPDVLVVGGGAAGLSAAIAASRSGATVALLDERKVGGGQFYKQAADGSTLDPQQVAGRDLVARARASGAEILDETEVWGAFEGLLFLAARKGTPLILRPKTAILATGAYERPTMVPGWTLPGVMTTGAAQMLWRSYRTLPGRRIAICGSGPLNLQVALELAKGGAAIDFVAEAGIPPWSKPGDAMAMTLADPALAGKGLRMLAELHRRGVPFRYRTRLARVEREEGGLLATFQAADGATQSFRVDALLMNAGFDPQNELLRLLGAGMDYDRERGHLRCRRDQDGRTSVSGLYAIGDCAGLGGAPAATVEGRLAGRAAAAECGARRSFDDAPDRRELKRHRRFQQILWRFYDIAPRPPETLADETILCRCEEITAGEVRAEMAGGNAGHAGIVKRATRVGMGRCQGRYCGPPLARLLAEASGKPIDDRSHFAPRIPVKPVAIATILATDEAIGDAS